MARVKIPFVGGTYTSRSRSVDLQECINLYPEIVNPDSKDITALLGTPGLDTLCVLTGPGHVRAMHTSATGRVFAVVGANVYEIDQTGTNITSYGSLATVDGVIDICDNGLQMLIAYATGGSVLDLRSNLLTAITDVNYPQGDTCVYKDGYFLVNKPGTNQVFYSAAYDATTWDAAQYIVKEGGSDPVIRLTKTNNDLIVLGPRTVTPWYSTGDPNGPFSPMSNAYIDIGCVAPSSVAVSTSTMFWLGSDPNGTGVVWTMAGYSPTRVSTHAIEFLIGQIADVSTAIGWTYEQEGHFFYMLTFPNGNRTLCYDQTTGMWHERGYWNATHGNWENHLAVCQTSNWGLNLVGSRKDGTVYVFDLDTYTDAGDPIRRVRTIAHIHKSMKRLFFNEFEIDMQKGIGLSESAVVCGTGKPCGSTDGANPGFNPRSMLSWSNDGGYSFGAERYVSMGLLGQYLTRIRWLSLGSSRDRVFRWACSDPVKIVIIAAYVDVEEELDWNT